MQAFIDLKIQDKISINIVYSSEKLTKIFTSSHYCEKYCCEQYSP